jgi:hypothetical protein
VLNNGSDPLPDHLPHEHFYSSSRGHTVNNNYNGTHHRQKRQGASILAPITGATIYGVSFSNFFFLKSRNHKFKFV